jgi:hypothetical protein
MLAAVIAPVTPAAAAQRGRSVPHQLSCQLVDGQLYLGNPGAVGRPDIVTCGIHFDQLRPRNDGVIVILRYRQHSTKYSVLSLPPSLRHAGRFLIGWRHHPGPAQLTCVLAGGRLSMGSGDLSRPHQKVTCTVRFYQLNPAVDGVAAVLTSGHHRTQYWVVTHHLPHRPTAFLPIRWTA